MGGVIGGPPAPRGMFVNINIIRLSIFISLSQSADRFLKFAVLVLCRLPQH